MGIGLLRWARKHGRIPHAIAGLALLVAPYLCPTPMLTLLVCGAISGGFVLALRLGW